MLTSIHWPRSPFSTFVGLARLAPGSGRLRLLEQVAKLAPASMNNCWLLLLLSHLELLLAFIGRCLCICFILRLGVVSDMMMMGMWWWCYAKMSMVMLYDCGVVWWRWWWWWCWWWWRWWWWWVCNADVMFMRTLMLMLLYVVVWCFMMMVVVMVMV